MEFEGISDDYVTRFRCRNFKLGSTKQMDREVLKSKLLLMSCLGFSMLRKRVYPHVYMEKTELPANAAFYSKLNMSVISDIDYECAHQVWNHITPGGDQVVLGYYHDTDV